VAKVVGEAVIEAFSEKYGLRPPVRLNSPSIIIYAEVIEDEFRLGILLTGERSRHRRGYRVYDHPAALKPSLAYSMIRISGARDGETIVDPMCGGGTIAIEAALTFPGSRIVCIDKNPAHIRGAKMNALAARVFNRIEFVVGDARRLPEILGEESIDVIISNPPYGIRLGDPTSVRRLYRSFLPAISRSLRGGGRATLITTESDYIINLLRKEVFRLKLSHIRKVRHGDLWASILVLEKS
jgi:tRNA (guanine6-N2)-methyltransferase